MTITQAGNIEGLVWMLQAFQVPFVLSIIVLFIVTSRSAADKELRVLRLPQIVPLGAAFFFNLCYLLLNLLSEQKLIALPHVFAYIALFDVLTSVSFTLAFINWRFGNRSQYSRKLLGRSFALQQILIGLLAVLSILVFTNNFQANMQASDLLPHFSVDLYLFDFAAYGLTANFLYHAANIYRPRVSDNTAKYFLAAGFSLWAFIHPLVLTVIHKHTDVWGFGLSTCAKISILYGLTSFFINSSRDAILKRNSILEENSENMTRLQNFITDISKETDMEKLEQMIIEHLHGADMFNYDYISIFKVDYLKQKLEFRDGHGLRDKKFTKPAWVRQDDIALEDDNIYTECIRRNEIFYYVSNQFIEKPTVKMPEKFRSAFITEPDSEYFINWFFVPLSNNANTDAVVQPKLGKNKFFKASLRKALARKKVIGLLQMGFMVRRDENVQQAKLENFFLVGHYASSLGSVYNRINEEAIKVDISGMLGSADKRSGDNEHEFITVLFEHICRKTHVDRGFISLLSLNVDDYLSEKGAILYQGASINEMIGPDDSADWLRLNESYRLNDIAGGGSEIRMILDHDGKKYGVAHLYSNRQGFFNEENISILFELLGETGRYYMEKKFHHAITSLSATEIMTTEEFANMRSVIQVIQAYFKASYVGIWTMEKVKTREFKPSYTSQELAPLYEFYNGRTLTLNRDHPYFKPTDISGFSLHNPFSEFGRQYGMQFVVTVPMAIDNQLYGFINIYSKRSAFQLFDEDAPFLRLVANRCMVSQITSELIRSFSEITDSLIARPNRAVLEEITKLAQRVLHCDPVLLFPMTKGQIQYEGFMYFGTLKDETKVKEGRKGSFIETILQIGEDQFYDNETLLPPGYEKNNHFWEREGISSMAVSLLWYRHECIGVMFFNYRSPRTFSPLIRELVKTFASFAATAIINARNVETIISQQKALEEKATFVEAKNMEIMERMERMLPVANARSLADIVRAVNHDIRNHLTKISMNLRDIQNNSLSWIKVANDRAQLAATIAIIDADINNSTNLIALFEPNSFRVTVEDIHGIAKKVAALFVDLQKRSGASIKVETRLVSKELPDMRCVKAEISMIIYNLITNARNAINEKWNKSGRPQKNPIGEIEIRVSFDQKDKVYVIAVVDDGIGIDNANIEDIYEAGYTTRPGKGLGIGLYFVKETVEGPYGGTVHCASAVDRGTTFELRLKQHN